MLKEYIKKVSEHHDLTTEEMKTAMNIIMDGRASSEQVSAFLIAMKMKKESPAEIAAASRVMVSKATPLPTDVKGIVDIVGTGGDCLNTFNISTTSSFVLCGAGLAVAKHGNRGVSSKSGSADTLEALHVNITLPPKEAAYLLEKVGITFLFAQTYHESMRHVGPIRRQLGLKTMFNILGPLTNPAHPDTYVIGAYNEEMADVMIHVYQEMGVKQAVVVHGDCGMDEVSMTGDTLVHELKDNQIRTYTISPEQFGRKRCQLQELVGGDSVENAKILMDILQGEHSAKRDAVLLNSGLALYISGRADTLEDGIRLAEQSIDSGQALAKFRMFQQLSQEVGA